MPEQDSRMLPACRAAVVIPAYNEEAALPSCLDSLGVALENLGDPVHVEVVVVDNGSLDGTSQVIKENKSRIPKLLLVEEKERGPGFARATGARLALSRAALRDRSHWEDFWIINTDADATMPETWLSDWFALFNARSSSLITGNAKFESAFIEQYPNSSSLLQVVGKHSSEMETLFGVINLDGFNSAIERRCYAAVGPFTQPRLLREGNHYVNLAGEDWDLSTRARAVGISPVRSNFSPVTASSRRFQLSPRQFVDGTAYESPFERVVATNPAPDIKEEDLPECYQAATLRLCVHFVEKPILVLPSLLQDEQVISRLGVKLVREVSGWIKVHTMPSVFYHRNEFIFDYLGRFHQEFGSSIRESLFNQDFPRNE